MKACSVCKEEKPLDQFYKNKNYKDKRSYTCKVCKRISNFKHRIKHRYGISEEEYNFLLEKAKFQCEICHKEVLPKFKHQGTKERACIDHNHVTGKIRGILCADCNWAIGLLKDNPDLCLSARNYLIKGKDN